MTSLSVLLESTADGQTTATVLGLPSFKVIADTRQSALQKIRQLLDEHLANTEVVAIPISATNEDNPWRKFGGVFKDDADFELIAQAIAAERQESP
ncbi:MAG: hypothetical protein ACFBSF_06290 [Leptolyngbyaceae cyanobacterium]